MQSLGENAQIIVPAAAAVPHRIYGIVSASSSRADYRKTRELIVDRLRTIRRAELPATVLHDVV